MPRLPAPLRLSPAERALCRHAANAALARHWNRAVHKTAGTRLWARDKARKARKCLEWWKELRRER